MRKLQIAIWAAALVATGSLQAQQRGTLAFGGAVLNQDGVLAGEMAQMSQPQALGTARSMALGGAFTSLGADLASMSINPAGLGMYRRNEIALTPMMTFQSSETPGTMSYAKNGKNRFSMANFGAALNAYEGTGTLTSFTVGIGLNRIADFNSRYSFSSESRYDPDRPDRLMPTIADIFSQQMNNFGVRPDREAEGGGPNGPVPVDAWNPNVWPAILAYDAYMLGNYGTVKDPIWAVERIGRNASVLHSMDVVNSGSINEFTISMGGNINNILYFGASIGIQSVHKKLGVTYQEEYGYFNTDGIGHDGSGNALAEQLDVMNLYQEMEMNGSGVNFKLGFTARPLTGLRVGVAFHTPTYYSLDRKFQSAAAGLAYANNDTDPNVTPDKDGYISTANDPNMTSPLLVDDGPNGWSFVSPTRLMFGASYTFGERGVISVDYERDWYNGIRIKDNPSGLDSQSWYNDSFRQNFKASNIVRVGAEFKPLPVLSLRAGFGYSGSMVRDDEFPPASPVIKQTTYYGAGVGFVLSRGVLLDLAYQYVSSKLSDYYLFYAEDKVGYTESALYSTDINRHNVALTLGFRF